MATNFSIKQGDRLPALIATLKDANGAVVPLSEEDGVTSITFSMRRSRNSMVVIENSVVAPVDAPNGVVRYVWQAGDTNTPGEYQGEFTVNYTGGLPLTFPNSGFIKIRIEQQVA